MKWPTAIALALVGCVGPPEAAVAELLDGTVRFDHGKLNFKPPSGGGALDWHQDYPFYPNTNTDMLAVGIMIEDCTPENVAANWDKITDPSGQSEYTDGSKQTASFLGHAARNLGIELKG